MEHIPKTFWYALSFCMVVLTGGLMLIAWSAASVSIEVDNYKLTLKSVLAETKTAQSQLEFKQKQLKDAEQRLDAGFARLQALKEQIEGAEPDTNLGYPPPENYYYESPFDPAVFESLDSGALEDAMQRLQELEQSLKE